MRKIITICIIGLFALNVQAQPVKTLKSVSYTHLTLPTTPYV